MRYCSKRACSAQKKNISVSLFSFALIYLLPVLIFFLVLILSVFSSGCKRLKEQVETLRKINLSFEGGTQFSFSYKIALEQKDIQGLGLKVGEANLYHAKVEVEPIKNTKSRIKIEFDTGFSSDSIVFFVPGVFIKGNIFSQNKVYSLLRSKKWIFREDRLPIPISVAYDEKKQKLVALLKLPAQYDFTDQNQVDSDSQEILVDTDIFGIGFDYDTQKIIFTFPFEEYPVFYRRKLSTESFYELPSKKALYNFSAKKSFDLFIVEIEGENFADAVLKLWKVVYKLYEKNGIISEKLPNLNLDYQLRVLSSFFRRYFYDGEKIKGFFSFVRTETGDVFLPWIEASFTGMALMNASNSILLGKYLKDSELIDKGKKVILSWIEQGMENGFFIDCFDTTSNSKCEFRPVFFKDAFFSRRNFESLLALYLAYLYETEILPQDYDFILRVKDAFIKGAENMMKLQRKDGSFARAYRFSGEEFDTSPAGTLFSAPVFIKAYEISGNPDFLRSAILSADFISKLAEKFEFYGSTIDANSEDKEAAMWAFISCYLVWKKVNQEKYFTCARRSLFAALWWFYLWNVPFNPNQLFYKIGLKTQGLSSVSVENIHVDVYLFFFPSLVSDFSSFEPDFQDELRKFSQIMISAVSEVVPTNYKNNGSVPGIIPEVIQQTWWDYGFGGKGTYNLTSATGWTVASTIIAFSQFLLGIKF